MAPTDETRQPADRLISARTLQTVGLILLVAAFVFWGLTGRESALMVGAALSLIGLGAYTRARDQLLDTLDRKNGGER